MSVWNYQSMFTEVDRTFHRKPTRPFPADGTVYDEEQSVRWNREKCVADQKQWVEEKRQLEIAYQEARTKINDELIQYITEEINISLEGARRLVERADYNFSLLEEFIDVYAYVKEVDQ